MYFFFLILSSTLIVTNFSLLLNTEVNPFNQNSTPSSSSAAANSPQTPLMTLRGTSVQFTSTSPLSNLTTAEMNMSYSTKNSYRGTVIYFLNLLNSQKICSDTNLISKLYFSTQDNVVIQSLNHLLTNQFVMRIVLQMSWCICHLHSRLLWPQNHSWPPYRWILLLY